MVNGSNNFCLWLNARVSRFPSFALVSNYIAVLVPTAVRFYSGYEEEKDHEQRVTRFVSVITFTEREMET